jgi:[ribosomal protein S5]-alanine N-acetyltransferase
MRAMPIETTRLLLRRPVAADIQSVFDRYACDPEVTRYMAFPRHRSLDDTRAFIAWSDGQWQQWGAGPLLVFSRPDGTLLGGAGLVFETRDRAETGYVFARDAWGKGYATEALTATVDLASSLGVLRLSATCHIENRASKSVLEKCGFAHEGVLKRHIVFPNLSSEPLDVLSYARLLRP